MRNLFSKAFASAIILLGSTAAKADLNYNYWALTSQTVPGVPTFTQTTLLDGFQRKSAYLYNSETKAVLQISDQSPINKADHDYWRVDPATKKFYIPSANGGSSFFHVLDPVTKTWSKECEGDETFTWQKLCDVKIEGGGFTVDNSGNTSLSIGDPDSPSVLSANGISGVITRDSSTGITKIGKNSLNFKEGSGPLEVWGTNTSGETVPFNVLNKLLINGRDVDQAIDNVGALSAALTGLPTVPEDSPLSCGVGVGVHSGSNAFSGGCASKVNERLTLNYAASIIPAKQDYQGTDNSWSGRAGFVFKLGKINKPTLISMKEKKGMQSKIAQLSLSNTDIKAANQKILASNEKIKSQNKELQAKVNSFELEKAALVARLENLEQFALANKKDEKTAFSSFNVSNLYSRMRGFLISRN